MKAINILKIVLFFTISLVANSQNLIPMLLKNGRYSYVQPKSKSIVIEKEFDEAKPFSDGVAFVKIRSKWGAINTQGELILKPQYSYLTQYNNGFIGGVLDENNFSEKEKIITDTLFHYKKNYIPDWDFITYFSKENNKSDYALIRMRNKGKIFIVNRNIEVISELKEPILDILYNENYHRFHGIIGSSGKSSEIRLNQNDLNVSNYSDGYFRIRRKPDFNTQEYYTDFLNLKGELLLNENYYQYKNEEEESDLFEFHDGIALVTKDEKYGYIDSSMNEVVPLKYSSLDLFSNGLAKVSSEGYISYINKKGIPLFPFEKKYDTFAEFNDGIALLSTNRLLTAINPNGEIIFTFPYPYSLVSPGKFSNGKLAIIDINEEFYNIIDKSGKIISKINAGNISNFSRDGFALFETEKYNGKLSLIDSKTGNESLFSKYDKIYFITEDYKNQIINTLDTKELNFEIDFTKHNLFIENLILVENTSLKFYVDNTGFEYKE
jgi:hypothetical protein